MLPYEFSCVCPVPPVLAGPVFTRSPAFIPERLPSPCAHYDIKPVTRAGFWPYRETAKSKRSSPIHQTVINCPPWAIAPINRRSGGRTHPSFAGRMPLGKALPNLRHHLADGSITPMMKTNPRRRLFQWSVRLFDLHDLGLPVLRRCLRPGGEKIDRQANLNLHFYFYSRRCRRQGIFSSHLRDFFLTESARCPNLQTNVLWI